MSDFYKISVSEGRGGQPYAKEISGTIVGPFGVSSLPESSKLYVVTHRHSGLKIPWLSNANRNAAIASARELADKYPFWASHKVQRIAEENGVTQGTLKGFIIDLAIKWGADGE